MKKAVVTLSIAADENNARWMAAGLPSKRAYAKRIGADFVNIDTRFLGGSVASEKYQIGPLLHHFDRVFYLDADTVIDPSAPDVFDVVPHGSFGIFDESTYRDGNGRSVRRALMAWLRDGWPDCPCMFYANNGVVVCGREHRWLFDHRSINWNLNTAEQTQMCFRIWEALKDHRIKVLWLNMAWNYMPRTWVGDGISPTGWVPEPRPKQVWVNHFPCHSPTERALLMESLNRGFGL